MTILWDNEALEGISGCFISIKICFSDRIKDFEGEGVAKTRPKRAGSGESRRPRLQAGSLPSRRLNGLGR